MRRSRASQGASKKSSKTLMVRLDSESKRWLAEAADLRRISISDYVRLVTVAQAKRELVTARQAVITMTAEEQRSFWNALQATPKLTSSQKRLSAIMRGRE